MLFNGIVLIMARYPFPSRNKKLYKSLRPGQDCALWVKPEINVTSLVSEIRKPIIEIGGPTESGYYFLDQAELPVGLSITNIQSDTSSHMNVELAKLVAATIDGRNMPYEDNSIGMFLMQGLPKTSDWYMELPEAERDEHEDQIIMEMDVALLEMEQVACGSRSPHDVQYAQRVPIYMEVSRCLDAGGLFMTDGSLTEVLILQRLGFELLAFTQEHIRPEQKWDGIYYEIVVRKK